MEISAGRMDPSLAEALSPSSGPLRCTGEPAATMATGAGAALAVAAATLGAPARLARRRCSFAGTPQGGVARAAGAPQQAGKLPVVR